jgi:Skp family chaperone for outer membrane proteins
MKIDRRNPKCKITALAAGLLLMVMTGEVRVVSAQEKSGAGNIALVDVQFLMENSAVSENVRAQIDRIRVNYQKEFKDKQEELTRLFQGIARERATLSQDAYQRRLGELQQRASNLEKEAQERQSKLDSAMAAASNKITSAIGQIAGEIMKERKFALVLPRSISIGAPTVPDITQEVLKRLNERMRTLAIEIPK